MSTNTATLPSAITTHRPVNTAEVQELVRSSVKVLPHGAMTKPPLLAAATNKDIDEAITQIDMTELAGIIEYDPGEYTFTAYAGTRLADIAAALAEHGQYMPFDPPLVDAGATLGGTIAAGLSASGRYRYGGVRDFILGVQFVDGQGRLVNGGGKVVKNAAGFDLPKLMVGSMGRLGILISATFKVFPAPPATATLRASLPSSLPSLAGARQAMARLMGGPYDLECLDLIPDEIGHFTLLVRIGGPADVLPARLDRLRGIVSSGDAVMEDPALWREAREFTWTPANSLLVKCATTVDDLPALDQALHAANAQRRYAVGGNVAWIAWPGTAEQCHQVLAQLGKSGLAVRGDSSRALLGAPLPTNFLDRVRRALDPAGRFLSFT